MLFNIIVCKHNKTNPASPFADALIARIQPKCEKSRWFYCVFAHACWKHIGFTVFSLKNVKKTLVLLCFRSEMWKKPLVLLCFRSNMVKKTLVLLCFRFKMLKIHWFYCVFAPTSSKNSWFYCVFVRICSKHIGFTVFSLKNIKKPLVL